MPRTRARTSHASLSGGYVSAVHALTGPHGRPMEAFAWTVEDASTARPVAGYGVDGVIRHKPDVVRRALPVLSTSTDVCGH